MVLGAIMTSPSDSTYTEPAIAINRVYTRHGDSGHTKLVGGQRVSKSALRIEAFGCLDELNAVVGMLRAECLIEGLEGLAKILLRVQHELFNLGSLLATLPEDVHPSQPQIGADDVHALEAEIDHFNADLPTLRSFVLPGSSRLDGAMHLARTVCRRVERVCCRLDKESPTDGLALRYLNRLSDAFFVWGRWANHELKRDETLWRPNAASSAAASTAEG